MKKKLLLTCLIALSILCSACHTGSSSGQGDDSIQDSSSNQETIRKETEQQSEAHSGTEEQSSLSPDLGANASLISNLYIKGGDVRSALSFSLTQSEWELSRLKCGFMTQDNIYADSWNTTASAVLETESGRTIYGITPEFYAAGEKNGQCEIRFFLDESLPYISVKGDPRLEGDYYSFQEAFSRPEVFTRYLCKADLYLYPTEDLWLLRNEIYAAHGRKFDSQVLNQYFSAQPWYRPLLEPDEFSDSLLSDVERKNIVLIRELEEEPFDERNTIDGIDYASEWDRLPAAPYLSWLKPGHETGLSADLTRAKDMGVYYAVPGSISIPASITQEQFSIVQNGGEAEVVLNELTGESQMLSLDPYADDGSVYGYLMYKQGETPSSHSMETGLEADLENGTYTLWQTSADTVMKIVYEGDIYLLKGAVTGAYTSISEASKNQKEIFAAEPAGKGGEDGLADRSVSGNELSYNEKGYFSAVYYLGD